MTLQILSLNGQIMSTNAKQLILVYYSGEYHYVNDKDANGSRNLTYYSVCGLPILARKATKVSKVPKIGICQECMAEVSQE